MRLGEPRAPALAIVTGTVVEVSPPRPGTRQPFRLTLGWQEDASHHLDSADSQEVIAHLVTWSSAMWPELEALMCGDEVLADCFVRGSGWRTASSDGQRRRSSITLEVTRIRVIHRAERKPKREREVGCALQE